MSIEIWTIMILNTYCSKPEMREHIDILRSPEKRRKYTGSGPEMHSLPDTSEDEVLEEDEAAAEKAAAEKATAEAAAEEAAAEEAVAEEAAAELDNVKEVAVVVVVVVVVTS